MKPVEVERRTYLPPPPTHTHLSYAILNCCVVLLITTFSGSAFHGMTTRCEKTFLRGSRLDLSLSSFMLCLFVEYQLLQRRYLLGFSSKPCIILCVSSGSPHFRLSSNVVSLHSFNLCSCGNFLNGVTILVQRCWICSSALISFFKYEAHVCMQGYDCVSFLVADGSYDLCWSAVCFLHCLGDLSASIHCFVYHHSQVFLLLYFFQNLSFHCVLLHSVCSSCM